MSVKQTLQTCNNSTGKGKQYCRWRNGWAVVLFPWRHYLWSPPAQCNSVLFLALKYSAHI